MNKFKKLLLTLAPLSAVAIATPIILTSCSTNATNPSTPSKPGGDSGTGGNDQKPNGNLTPDNTNLATFVPQNDGLYKKVEETIKAGKAGEESAKVEEAFTGYKDPTEQDVKDAINIWSFNKWNDASKIKDVTFVSNLVDLNATKKVVESKNKWDISFKYKFQVIAKVGDKTENVLGEKMFTASQIDLTSNVSFDTQATSFTVNGESKIDEVKPKSLYVSKNNEESKVISDIKTFLSTKNSVLDSKTNYKTFVNVKKIVGQKLDSPIWMTSTINTKYPALVVEGNVVTLPLNSNPNPTWNNASANTSFTEITTTFKKPEIQKIITDLIELKDYEEPSLTLGNEVVEGNNSNMDITITFKKKSDKEGIDSKPMLTFKVKGFKKSN